jgi:hypothetical protein
MVRADDGRDAVQASMNRGGHYRVVEGARQPRSTGVHLARRRSRPVTTLSPSKLVGLVGKAAPRIASNRATRTTATTRELSSKLA